MVKTFEPQFNNAYLSSCLQCFLQIISSGLMIKIQHIIFTATLYNMNEKEIIGRKNEKKKQTTVPVTQKTNQKHLL